MDDERTDMTCLECGLDWASRGDEHYFPLCSTTCLRHFLETQSVLHTLAFRNAIEMWGTDHGYCLLESEVDALCMCIQPFCQLLKEAFPNDPPSTEVGIYDTSDPSKWVAQCRSKCKNSIMNTGVGAWLGTALSIIEGMAKTDPPIIARDRLEDNA